MNNVVKIFQLLYFFYLSLGFYSQSQNIQKYAISYVVEAFSSVCLCQHTCISYRRLLQNLQAGANHDTFWI